ncbi:MAG: GDSL-type esterase/lipase family protein [Planctomycetia bacterium]|nr:GDSL-type esterase/lipase family protein [Planctomycetia bacterium]
MQSLKPIVFVFLSLLLSYGYCPTAPAEPFRAVVIGDSITGHSMNLPFGYTHEVRKTLAEAGETEVEFIPLGGSGSTIEAWTHFITNSHENRQRLDIPAIYIKDELDKGADIIFILLGTNDALCPAIVTTEEGYAAWKTKYQTLINLVRERTQTPRIILALPSMLTETPFSFKNQMMDRMESIMRELAEENEENGVEFLDMRGEMKRHFINARLQDGEIYFAPDCVHPQKTGHAILTWQFLKALGRETLAQKYYDANVPEFVRDFDRPGLALFVQNTTKSNCAIIKGFARGVDLDALRVRLPEGLALDKLEKGDGMEFTLFLSGRCVQNSALVEVESGDIRRSVKINAPFWVAPGIKGFSFGNPDAFDYEKAVLPTDAAVFSEGFLDRASQAGGAPPEVLYEGKPLEWILYYPTRDATGGDDVNAIDFCSISNGSPFEAAYVVRRVFSPKAQGATLNLKALSFSTMALPVVYLNGQHIYQGCVSPRHKQREDAVQIELKEGWNILAARVHHFQWQWAVSFELVGEGLVYDTAP